MKKQSTKMPGNAALSNWLLLVIKLKQMRQKRHRDAEQKKARKLCEYTEKQKKKYKMDYFN